MPWLAVAAVSSRAPSPISRHRYHYQENIALIAVSFASVAVTPFILKLFYPFYHRHQVTTSYQFIQKRFGNNAQRSVSTLFVLSRLGWLVVVYAPALAPRRCHRIFSHCLHSADGVDRYIYPWRHGRCRLDRCFSISF